MVPGTIAIFDAELAGSGWTVSDVCLEDMLVVVPASTGAVSALIERAATAGLHTLTAQTKRDNTASIRVPEHKGFVQVGLDSDRDLHFVRDLAPGRNPQRMPAEGRRPVRWGRWSYGSANS